MDVSGERRYKISEVSKEIGVPEHLLRQWEDRFPQLKPKRDRANRRYYLSADIQVARRIKELLRHDGMTTEGARKQLARELYGAGRPKTNQDVLNLIDQIEDEVRTVLHMLDSE